MLCLIVLSALLVPARATDYYVTFAGAGAKTGTSWADAYAVGSLWTTVNTTMQPGDTLYLGGQETATAAHYGDYRLTISSGGTSTARKSLIGVDRGFGFPKFVGIQPTKSYTTITLADTVGYWTIKNLHIEHREMGLATAGGAHPGLVIDGVTVRDISSRGFSFSDSDGLLVQNCRAERYNKLGFMFSGACDGVTVKNCVADCSGAGNADDPSWYAVCSDPVGFNFHIKNSTAAPNTNILLEDCITMNNDEDTTTVDDYEQGDGFKMENSNDGVTLVRCKSLNNQDAAYDLKGTNQTLQDCIAANNSRYGFKIWIEGTLTNCVSVNNGARQMTLPATSPGHTITAINCTFHSRTNTQAGVITEASGNTAVLNNCILSFAEGKGTYTGGPGTFTLTGTAKLENTAITTNSPMYINPVVPWDGEGNDFDNQTYGSTKGYNSAGYTGGGGGGPEIIIDNTDATGVTLTGSWSASTYTAGYHGTDYLTDGNTGKGTKSVRFTPTIPTTGSYDVFMMWTSGTNRATNVPVDIVSSSGTTTLSLDQTVNGGQWVSLGAYDFVAGTTGSVLVRTTGTTGFVIADAIGFVGATPPAIASPARIINNLTSKSLRPYNSGTGDNVNIVQSTYNNTWTSQHWTITDLGNTYYSIRNVYTGKSLRPAGSSTASGANITQYTYDSSWQSEQWELIPEGAGYYGIRNRYSGLALRPLNAGTGDDVQIVQEAYNASDASMKWLIAAP
jgi:hypothetical protein